MWGNLLKALRLAPWKDNGKDNILFHNNLLYNRKSRQTHGRQRCQRYSEHLDRMYHAQGKVTPILSPNIGSWRINSGHLSQYLLGELLFPRYECKRVTKMDLYIKSCSRKTGMFRLVCQSYFHLCVTSFLYLPYMRFFFSCAVCP